MKVCEAVPCQDDEFVETVNPSLSPQTTEESEETIFPALLENDDLICDDVRVNCSSRGGGEEPSNIVIVQSSRTPPGHCDPDKYGSWRVGSSLSLIISFLAWSVSYWSSRMNHLQLHPAPLTTMRMTPGLLT